MDPHTRWRNEASPGFTIVELLIVIVIIGILAAIVVVAYNGIMNRAYDSSIQSNLENLGKLVSTSQVINGVYPMYDNAQAVPTDMADLSNLKLKASKSAYGNDLISSGQHYNLLYCFTVSGYSPTNYAFVASSKSGNVYAWTLATGKVNVYPTANWTAPGAGWGTICPDVLGVSAGNSGTGLWEYSNGVWNASVGS